MDVSFENFGDLIEERAKRMEQEAALFREDMKHALEDAKKNEILRAISRVNARLDEIEKRLPPVEEEEEVVQ